MKALRLICISFLLTLAACRTFLVSDAQFEKISRGYNDMIRWQELDRAKVTFVDQSFRPAFEATIAAMRGVTIADYRVLSMEVDQKKGKATVKVEFDYYILPSTRLKKAVDLQQWRYAEEKGKTGWYLETLLPDFR